MNPSSASDACTSADSGSPLRQLVFRAEFDTPTPVELMDDCEFFTAFHLPTFLKYLGRYRQICGTTETIKACMRLMRGRQFFYALLEQGEIIHYGWATAGTCRHYRIEPTAYVIGPIWSSPKHRGRGGATYATMHVINTIVKRDAKVIYIDTSEDNGPCLRVIEKCGFGPSVTSYPRMD